MKIAHDLLKWNLLVLPESDDALTASPIRNVHSATRADTYKAVSSTLINIHLFCRTKVKLGVNWKRFRGIYLHVLQQKILSVLRPIELACVTIWHCSSSKMLQYFQIVRHVTNWQKYLCCLSFKTSKCIPFLRHKISIYICDSKKALNSKKQFDVKKKFHYPD
jgi:hypothetical protein